MENKTAVEWLVNEHFGGIENCTPDFRSKIQQAKQLEKEQIEKAFNRDVPDMSRLVRKSFIEMTSVAEQYYKETFKSE
jgi:hypothetical protein